MWRPRLPAPGTEKQTRRPGQWTLPPESDPERYWASNKPHSVADQPWYKDNNPYLGLPRKYLGITRRRLPRDRGGESQNPPTRTTSHCHSQTCLISRGQEA
ncbi:hypothetical protein B0T09DRAFT_325409 [Sordaria sp. MPI-SDFR-AT-0083]|nr:hypothetical protein B0T09DRAFT_325409 [Sordaria sp. MPI-SDFR-AT-0083]